MKNNEILKEISKEIDKIFKIITESQITSLDELDELSKLNNYLEFRLHDYVEDYNKNLRLIYKKLKIKINICKIYSLLCVPASILLLLNFSPASLLGIVLLSCISLRIKYNMKEKNNYIDNLADDIDDLKNKMQRLMITIENNETKIFKQQKDIYVKNINEIKENKSEIIKLNKANELIQNYFLFEIFPTNEKDEIRELAIKILQLDLNTNNPSLEYLLIEAKEKVKNNEINLKRKR